MTYNEKLNIYQKELLEWNKKFNLTAITDPEEIKIKHFEDSLTIVQAVKLDDQTIIDIGTGAGFPGIPLKIAYPNLKLTLLEATKKKCTFLEHIVKTLDLKNVKIIWGRAEDLQKTELKNSFDIAVARAVAKLDKLVMWCLPFVRSGGVFVAQKQADCAEEIKNTQKNIKTFNGKIQEIKKVKLSNQTERVLIMIKKV